MGVGGVQVGFMSGFGLGGIAERGRGEDFFPSVASFAESTGKCINQKQNRFLLAQRSVGFFDQRSLHLSKVPESPVRQQEWGGDWGSVSWWRKEKEAEKDPVPPKSSRNSQEPNCSWQRPCLCHSRAKLTSFKFHPPRKFILVLCSTVSCLNLQIIHATIRHGTLSYRREDLAVQRSWMIHAVDKAFTGEPGLDLFPTSTLNSFPHYGLLYSHSCFCKSGLAHAQLVKEKWCWFNEEIVLVHIHTVYP